MADTPANENSLHAQDGTDNGAPQMNDNQDTATGTGPAEAGGGSDADLAQGRRDTIVRLMEAIQTSEKQGVPSRVVHESLLALSISVFVGLLGRDGAALLVERLPEKIRNGEFGEGIDPSAE